MLEAMSWLTPKLLVSAGVAFFLIGFITLLGVVGHLQVAGDIPWLLIAYAGMNFLLGFGFYMCEKWILPLLGLNLAGYTLLYAIVLLTGGFADLSYMSVHILVAGTLWGLVYGMRRSLADTRWGRLQGAVFFVLWASTYVYSFVSALM